MNLSKKQKKHINRLLTRLARTFYRPSHFSFQQNCRFCAENATPLGVVVADTWGLEKRPVARGADLFTKQMIATFRSQFTMYLGSNVARPTDRTVDICVTLVSRSRHASPGRDVRGGGGRKGCFGGLLIELRRLAMFPAPEETSMWPEMDHRRKK